MEFIMRCYPVREVTLWQWIGNPHSFSLTKRSPALPPRTQSSHIPVWEREAQTGCGWMNVLTYDRERNLNEMCRDTSFFHLLVSVLLSLLLNLFCILCYVVFFMCSAFPLMLNEYRPNISVFKYSQSSFSSSLIQPWGGISVIPCKWQLMKMVRTLIALCLWGGRVVRFS